MSILITGGTGYIGSHIALALLEENNDVILFDNLSNSRKKISSVVDFLAEPYSEGKLDFYRGDLKHKSDIDLVFDENDIDVVIHLANTTRNLNASKGQIEIIENDVVGTTNLLKSMSEHNVNKLIFGSSMDSKRDFTKPMIESIFKQLIKTNSDMSIVVMNCPEVCGTHHSAALGYNFCLNYDSPFVRCMESLALKKDLVLNKEEMTLKRDIIYVIDAANAFVKAIPFINEMPGGIEYFSIGSGVGYTGQEIVDEFEASCSKKFTIVISEEPVTVEKNEICSINKAVDLLSWKPLYGLNNICSSAYRWTLRNEWEK